MSCRRCVWEWRPSAIVCGVFTWSLEQRTGSVRMSFFFSSHPPTTHIYITLRHTSFSSRQMRFIWAVHEATPVECGIISFCKMMLELIGLTTCLNIMIYTGMHAYQYWYSLLSGNSASCHTFYSIANFIRFDHFTFTFKTSMKQRKCKNVNVQKHTIVFTNKYCMYI